MNRIPEPIQTSNLVVRGVNFSDNLGEDEEEPFGEEVKVDRSWLNEMWGECRELFWACGSVVVGNGA